MTEQEKLSAPTEEKAAAALRPLLPGLGRVVRTAQGSSTYVYRVEYKNDVCYARFLPENATFGVEVLAHRLLAEQGVPVPKVLCYLPKEPVTGHSLLVVSKMPGQGADKGLSGENLRTVLYQAGAALARLHTVPVQGFGWIDRAKEHTLTGEFPTFSQYFTAFWGNDLHALARYGLSRETVRHVEDLMDEALSRLETHRAVLVHGDFCLEHIYHQNGRFTGIIDFGEIRGNNPLFDLGTFLQDDTTPGQFATAALLEGYESEQPLGEEGRRGVALMALAFDLRFVGKKAGSPSEHFWVDRLKKQLARL